jgi:predicted protein tyrosine phosphatase
MKVLFICNQNRHRSKTAEELFKSRLEAKSAGLYSENPVTEKQIEWADFVVVMEDFQRTELAKRFPEQYLKKRIVSLGIPDQFNYNQPELIELLESRMQELLQPLLN